MTDPDLTPAELAAAVRTAWHRPDHDEVRRLVPTHEAATTALAGLLDAVGPDPADGDADRGPDSMPELMLAALGAVEASLDGRAQDGAVLLTGRGDDMATALVVVVADLVRDLVGGDRARAGEAIESVRRTVLRHGESGT